MTAELKFNLDNKEDEIAHKKCVIASEMVQAIWNVKHNNVDLTKEQILEKMHEEFEPLNIDNLTE